LADVWKTSRSTGRAPSQVAVPGGIAGGLRQMVSGAPVLQPGREYVLFLWTSPRGLTQIMGLSQGLFSVESKEIAARAAASERIVDAAGYPVQSNEIRLPVSELKAQILQALGGKNR